MIVMPQDGAKNACSIVVRHNVAPKYLKMTLYAENLRGLCHRIHPGLVAVGAISVSQSMKVHLLRKLFLALGIQ